MAETSIQESTTFLQMPTRGWMTFCDIVVKQMAPVSQPHEFRLQKGWENAVT